MTTSITFSRAALVGLALIIGAAASTSAMAQGFNARPNITSTTNTPPNSTTGGPRTGLLLYGTVDNCPRTASYCRPHRVKPVVTVNRTCKAYMYVEIDGAIVKECRKYEDE